MTELNLISVSIGIWRELSVEAGNPEKLPVQITDTTLAAVFDGDQLVVQFPASGLVDCAVQGPEVDEGIRAGNLEFDYMIAVGRFLAVIVAMPLQ